MNNRLKVFLIFVSLSGLFTCVDPFTPKLNDFQSLLVVDALLTDENRSDCVTLTKTKKNAQDTDEKVCWATVIIKDDLGNSEVLTERRPGSYYTDSLRFRGEVGRTYTLSIKTAEGNEYESLPCLMLPAQDLDSVYYAKADQILNNEIKGGISIYVHSRSDGQPRYYRWTYEELWKFNLTLGKEYNYLGNGNFAPCDVKNVSCYKGNRSREILIGESNKDFSANLVFIPSDITDRLTDIYRIRVRQLSISEKEYNFWHEMKLIAENGGDIFDKQPFQITGNIFNKKNSAEKVLGYFQVSSATEKRLYVTVNEIKKMGLPIYTSNCEPFALDKSVLPASSNPSWDEVYRFATLYGFVFLYPVYDDTGSFLVSMMFAEPECADCTTTGTATVADF